MMNLEDKIIKKVYTTESINICARTAFKIIVMTISGAVGVISAVVLFQILSEQKTLYQELPKLQLFLVIVCLTVFTAIIVTSLSHFNRFSNRIKSLIRFWFMRKI